MVNLHASVRADMARTSTPHALPRLTSLRAFAAASVLIYHFGTHGVVRHTAIGDMGFVGVPFFFVLSGFVLTWSFTPGTNAWTFYRRRFARVYPSHLVVTLFALVLITPVAKGWASFVASVSLTQSWFTSDSIVYGMNGVTWTLACEAAFYLAFPLAIVLLRRLSMGMRWAIAAAWFAAALTFSLASEHLPYRLAIMADASPLVRFNEFLLGVVAAMALANGWRPRIHMWWAVLAGAGSLVLCLLLPIPRVAANQLMVPAFLAMILAAVRSDVDHRLGILNRRWLVWAGEVSFTFYLVHELVMLNVRSWLGFDGLQMAVIVAVVAATCAIVLHRVVEQPFRSRLRDTYETASARS